MASYNNPTKADEYLTTNIKNKIHAAMYKYQRQFTAFLDEHEQAVTMRVLQSQRAGNYIFFGGAKNCRRLILCVYPEGEEENVDEFPITALTASYSESAGVRHGDVLGSLMGLQLERDCIGDIIVDATSCTIFVKNEIADFIIQNLNKIGRANVTVTVKEGEIPDINQEYEELNGTVASLRLDCIVSLITGKSRTTAVEMITARRVWQNQFEVTEVSKRVDAGDIIVVRGYGKFLIDNDIRLTKRNRIHVMVKKFI